MSEPGWGDDFDAPKKSRGVPTWVWAGGCGCLLALAAVVVGGYLLLGRFEQWAEEATDPDVQWTELGAFLPFDERPPYGIQRAPIPSFVGGFRIWFLTDQVSGTVATVYSAEAGHGAEMLSTMMDPAESEDMWQTRRFEAEAAKIELAGFERPCLRFQLSGEGPVVQSEAKPWAMGLTAGARGAAILVDLGVRSTLAVQLMRSESREPFTDEEVHAFLEPFRLREVR